MSRGRSYGIAALLVAGCLTVAGCGASAQGAATPPPEVASLQTPPDGGPGIITLSQAAHDRLAVQTAAVSAGPGGLVIPYAAVVYEPDGSAWVYAQAEPLTYQRAPITITGVTGDQVTLAAGPPPGTLVVSQGAAELVGVETGIDGEE
jgi:hypothetical protein